MSYLPDILLAIAVVCGVIYWWLKYYYNYWQRNGIPYIKPTLVLGNTKVMFTFSNSFGLHLSDIYNDKRMQNEHVVGVYIFHKPGLIVRNPELLKSILIRDFNKFPNHYGNCDPHTDKLGTNNLFFVKNQKWRAIRTKLTPVFTSGKIKQMYPLMQEIGEDLEDHLANYPKNSNAFIAEIKEISANFTTDLIATIAYGLKVKSLKDPNTEFRLEGRKIFDFNLSRGFTFFIAFFLPKLVSLFRVKIFTESFSKLIRKNIGFVMDERERSGATRNDLIDILVALRKEAALEDGDHFAKDNDFLVAQAAVFTTAGFETSSSTMTFALYELSKRPQLQERLRQEIHDALVAENGAISYEKLQSLEYLGMVIDETLRLYPVLPFLDRECVLQQGEKPFSLKPFYDYEIPNGMPVYVPIFGIQRDANYWANPNEFDPERFSPENKKQHKPMSYMPFGIGPRNCIGSRIGLLQTRIGLVRILKNHYVTTCDRTIKEMKFDPKALLLACSENIYLNMVYDGLFENSRK